MHRPLMQVAGIRCFCIPTVETFGTTITVHECQPSQLRALLEDEHISLMKIVLTTDKRSRILWEDV
jgi:hypothetical protein